MQENKDLSMQDKNRTYNLFRYGLLGKYPLFLFWFLLFSLLSTTAFGKFFLYSANDIASIRRLTQLQVSQMIEQLSHRWDVNFLNREEYMKIVKALEVENAILLYETPYWITEAFNRAEDPNQVVEDCGNVYHYEGIRGENGHSIVLYPKGFQYHPSSGNYVNSFGSFYLEHESGVIQDRAYLDLSITSNSDPTSVFQDMESVDGNNFLDLAENLSDFLEEQGIAEGQSVTLYLKDYNIENDQLKIGVLTLQRQINWTLTRRMAIDIFSDFSPASQKIREQIPLALHEAAHELVRRTLLAEVTDPTYLTVFPSLHLSNDNQWHLSSGSTHLTYTSSAVQNYGYLSSHIAQKLAGMIIDRALIPDSVQYSSRWDQIQAESFALEATLCLEHFNIPLRTCSLDQNANDILNTLSLSDQQNIQTKVEGLIDYGIFLARYTLISNLDTLKALAISVLTRNIMDLPSLIDFYDSHPIVFSSTQENHSFTFDQIRSDDFMTLFRQRLQPVFVEISNILIANNAQQLRSVSSPDVPLAEYSQWLTKRHNIRPERIGNILLDTWTENIEFFRGCPFCTSSEIVQIIEFRQRSQPRAFERHLMRPFDFVRKLFPY